MPMQYDAKYVFLNVCQGLELICIVQCFVEWFAISGEEMLGVDNYHILYYNRGIEAGQPIYQMHADCWKISCFTFVLLTYLSFFLYCFVDHCLSSVLFSVVYFQCWLCFWYRQSLSQYNLSLRHRWPWPILVGYLVQAHWFYCSQKLKLFGFQIFRFWAYPMKVIPETRRAHSIWYLCFYYYTYPYKHLLCTKCACQGLIHRNTRKRHSSL